MAIKPIKTDTDHAEAVSRVEELWSAAAGSPEADELEVLVTLVDAYEGKRWPIEAPDPVDALRYVWNSVALPRRTWSNTLGIVATCTMF